MLLLLPPQLKQMSTKYKAVCGCKLIVIMAQFQASLNACRLYLLRRLENEADQCESPRDKHIKKARSDNYQEEVFPNSAHRHTKPNDDLSQIQFPNVEGFHFSEMKCILRTCRLCSNYLLLREEQLLTDLEPPISFHIYQKFSCCRIHGILEYWNKECQKCEQRRTSLDKKPGKFLKKKDLTLFKRQGLVFF